MKEIGSQPRCSINQHGRDQERWWKSPLSLGACLLSIGLVALLDTLTGPELSFSIFYLLPVGLGVWFLGLRPGIALCLVAAVAWLGVELGTRTYSHPVIAYWNAGVRLAFFLLGAFYLSTLHKTVQEKEELLGKDSMTGASNRRKFCELTVLESKRAKRTLQPLSIADLPPFFRPVVTGVLGGS